MHLNAIADRAPDRAAVIMASTDEVITFDELAARANRLAHLFRDRGLERGNSIAIFMENHPRFLEVAWAAQQAGLYYTAVNSHLQPDEASYIVDDCDARLLVSTAALAEVAAAIDAPGLEHRLLVGGALDGWESYDAAVAGYPDTLIADACEGDFMLYSSGTTGRPKGIRRPLSFASLGEGMPGALPFLQALGLADGDVYLCPAPLYHAAPLAWSTAAHRLGATVVVLERFDPIAALAVIERYGVTHVQMVPTMFVRMLKLPEEQRSAHELSSLRAVVHSAAPCPTDVKRRMIDWWGPIISEFYSATEGIGATFITADEWLEHPGSVGRAMMGVPHILDDDGNELPSGEVGSVWFSDGVPFDYHKAPDKTAEAKDPRGWATVGDIGYLDDDGYLYLTDRQAFMIIRGGVNIYPQEIEDLLVGHPSVMDAAVIGVPDEDFGEAVTAVVQPVVWEDAGAAMEAELIELCRRHLAPFKCPTSWAFEAQLPRLDTGKLYKRALVDRYATATP